jgi:hypothetical protein
MREMDVYDILELLGFFLRVVGVLVFGVAIGWLALKTILAEKANWQLAIATMLGLLGTFVLLGRWIPGGGTLGAFALGAGLAILGWGVLAGLRKKE